MNREDRQILWSAFFAGLITFAIVCAVWLTLQIVAQLEIQLS